MRLSEFHALCSQVWASKADPYGDVIELQLTPSSRLELVLDVMTTDRRSSKLAFAGTGPITLGTAVSEVINPVTRSAVAITDSDDVDHVLISYGERKTQRECVP